MAAILQNGQICQIRFTEVDQGNFQIRAAFQYYVKLQIDGFTLKRDEFVKFESLNSSYFSAQVVSVVAHNSFSVAWIERRIGTYVPTFVRFSGQSV